METSMNYLDAITDFIFVEQEPVKSDLIFVPGNAFPFPSERAAELWRSGYAPYVLPSGRYAKPVGHFVGVAKKQNIYDGDYETEWEFMKDVLVHNGVPEDAVLKENAAQYTYQNALLSRQVLIQAGIAVKKAILCCNPYHARRCLMYYSMVFPDVSFTVCPAHGTAITRENWKDSVEGLKLVLGEVERCGKQFAYMLCGPTQPGQEL